MYFLLKMIERDIPIENGDIPAIAMPVLLDTPTRRT